MGLKKFRAYQLSVRFYRLCLAIRCSKHLKDQLDRASSSISLNLSEGSAKSSTRDRLKFYFIAFGSLRECQTILELVGESESCKSLEKQISDTNLSR